MEPSKFEIQYSYPGANGPELYSLFPCGALTWQDVVEHVKAIEQGCECRVIQVKRLDTQEPS
jgi:hypothetical protein